MNDTQTACAESMGKGYETPPIPETQVTQQDLEFRAYYDGTKFYLDNGKAFVPMDGRSIKSHVKLRGFVPLEIETIICRIQTENYVKYNGPLAGKMRGVYESNGDRDKRWSSPGLSPAEKPNSSSR